MLYYIIWKINFDKLIPFTDTYKKRYILLPMILLLFALGAKAQQFDEYEVKSGYLFNFPLFVDLPNKQPTSEESYSIGIYGDSQPFDAIIQQMVDMKNKPKIKWFYLHFGKTDQIIKCDILFITKVKPSEAMKVLALVKNQPILTVGDNIPNFCEMGGMINFLPKDSKKPFEIYNAAAEASKIKIRSKLLAISKIVP